jgi:DNA-binding transcriptional LysR family regulator
MHASILRYFDEVARYGSIRRAAEALNVASSAVNRQILNLEHEIGKPLFERRRNGVVLTSEGQVLLNHARQTLRGFEQARMDIAALSGIITGHVRIICLESLAVRFMPQAVAEIAALYPELTVSVIVVNPSELSEELRSGRSDFGILFVDRRHNDVDVTLRFRTAIGAVMRPDHPLARKKALTLTQCAPYPVLMLHDRWLLDATMATEFTRSGARLNPRIISNSIDFMRQAILDGLGIGFFTPVGFADEIRSGSLVHVPLAEAELADSEIGVLVPRVREMTTPARYALAVIERRLLIFAALLPHKAEGRTIRAQRKGKN